MLHWINYMKKAGFKVCSAAPAAATTLPPSYEELVAAVENWGHDRKITVNSTPQAQLLKCMSELGELADGTLKDDRCEIVDGLGDVLVTLIMYARLQGVSLQHCLECAYDTIKDRKGYLTPEGVFVKEADPAD